MKIPGLTIIPENADAYVGAEFSPGQSTSDIFSITADTSAMANPGTGTFQIFGSNKSALKIDMVAVKDEALASAAISVALPFVKNYFPFKYIGIQFNHAGNVGAGTLTFYLEQKIQRVSH